MEAARAWGVPLSIMRGRIVADGEPLWLDSDRDWAVALMLEEAETHQCGHPVSESFAQENDGTYFAESLRCHACAAIARQSADINKQAASETEPLDPSGLVITARRRQ